MRYLLDTCVISEIVKKRPEIKVLEWVKAQDESGLHLSVLTIGEIQKGISKLGDGKKARRLQRWVEEELLRRFTGRILGIDHAIATRWGMLSGAAERKGQKVPVLDGLLAATALETGMTLVTRNTLHVRQTGASILDPWGI